MKTVPYQYLIGTVLTATVLGAYDEMRVRERDLALVAQANELRAAREDARVAHQLLSARAQWTPPQHASTTVTNDAQDPTKGDTMRRLVAQLQAEKAEAITAREALWEKTYKRPTRCENPPDNAAFIQCGNDYAKARAAFNDAHPIESFVKRDTQ